MRSHGSVHVGTSTLWFPAHDEFTCASMYGHELDQFKSVKHDHGGATFPTQTPRQRLQASDAWLLSQTSILSTGYPSDSEDTDFLCPW